MLRVTLMLMMTVAGVYQVTSQTEDQDQYLDELEHLSGGNQYCTVLHWSVL